MFIGGATPEGSFSTATTESEAGIAMLHDLCKRILYRHCNSNAFETTRDYTPYWIIPVAVLNIILLAGAVLSVVFLIIRPRKKSKIVIKEVK